MVGNRNALRDHLANLALARAVAGDVRGSEKLRRAVRRIDAKSAELSVRRLSA